jgi:hypothetical protein
VVEALAGDRRPAGVDGAVEAEPGLHSTSAPCSSAHAATSSSSQAMNVGSARRRRRPAGQPAGEVGPGEAVEHHGQPALGRA